MGIKIDENFNIEITTQRRADGTVSRTRTRAKPNETKKKKPHYNLKDISRQLLRTKTPMDARKIASKARAKVASLRKMLKSGKYDEAELGDAIIHAEKMERIARKRVRHLLQESSVKKSDDINVIEQEDKVFDLDSAENYDGMKPEMEQAMQDMQYLMEEVQADMQEMMEEVQADMQETMQDTMQDMMQDMMEEMVEAIGLDELGEELLTGVSREMEPADLEQLKKKHRADELRDIAEADMKYLKAMFDKLATEKLAAAYGVSLEIGGSEVPVMVDTPALVEGAAVDVMV